MLLGSEALGIIEAIMEVQRLAAVDVPWHALGSR